MNDHLLVEGIRRRDSSAPAAMYDAYADRLYAYCWFGLRSGDAAQVAVRDTFVAAEAHIERLRDADRFGPWLYALARLECSRRMAYHGGQPDIPIASHDQDDVDQRIMAWQAVTGLPPLSREILELRVRHQLSVPDLALVFSLSPKEAQAALDLAQIELEAALTAELLAHEGPHGCAGRRDLLRERRGELSPGLRERLLRHARECAACGTFRPRTVSAAKVYGLLPQAQAPESLRRRVMSCFYDPELVSYRLFVATRLTEFGPNGFPYQPRQPTMPRARGSRRLGRGVPLGAGGRSFRRLTGVLALVSVLLLGVVGGVMLLNRLTVTEDGRPSATSPNRRPTLIATPPTPTPPASSPRPVTGEPADPGDSITVPGGPLLSATFPLGTNASAAPPSALPSPPPGKHYQSGPGPTGGPSRPGGTGTLSASPLYLDLGDGSTGAIELRADEGAVGWQARTGGPVRLSQSSGHLAAGETISLTVYAYREPGSEGQGTITFEPGGTQVTVSWRPAAGGGSDPGPAPTGPPPSTSPSSPGPTGATQPGSSAPSSPADPPHDPPPSSDPPSGQPPPPSNPPASSSSAPPPQESSPAEPSSGGPSSSGDPAPSSGGK